jgi:hypothetical protein
MKKNGSNVKNNLNPWFITGFADAESSFVVSVRKNPKFKIG